MESNRLIVVETSRLKPFTKMEALKTLARASAILPPRFSGQSRADTRRITLEFASAIARNQDEQRRVHTRTCRARPSGNSVWIVAILMQDTRTKLHRTCRQMLEKVRRIKPYRGMWPLPKNWSQFSIFCIGIGRERWITRGCAPRLSGRRHCVATFSAACIRFYSRSLEALRSFPAAAKREAGCQLDRVQHGLEGSWEIRIMHEGQIRVIYIAKLAESVYVLHAFQKKTQKTRKQNIDAANQAPEATLAARHR